MKISIVVPALNEEKFLPECLGSLRGQDYQGEYEIIVADNGSTDGTAEIARKFGARLVACYDKKNVFYARQVGAGAARGDIIVQADADTFYPREWLQKISDAFVAHPEAAAVAGRFFYKNPPWWARFEYGLRHTGNSITAFFGCPAAVSGATLAFRRQAFLAVGGYNGLAYSPDQYGITRRLSKVGKVLYDKNLNVLTSPRAVQKPALVVIWDLFVHLGRRSAFFVKNRLSPMWEFAFKTPRRRVAFKVLPLPVVLLSLIAYGYFVPTSPVFGKVYYEAATKEKVVALTFDDGPNEPYTSQVLDILAGYHIKATFFLIGRNVELYPDTARSIIAEGNVIGNHSYSHNANHALTEFGARDLVLAQKTIYEVTGVIPGLYRPPHGRLSPWELQAVKKEGMVEVTWSVSANDQHVLAFLGKPTAIEFAKEIVDDTHPGEIILLHDGYGTQHSTPQADRSLTVRALPMIIEGLQAKGYRFVTVPELLKVPEYNRVLP